MAAKKTVKKTKHARKTARKPRNKPYDEGLERSAANHQPLTPLSFLERAGSVFPRHTAIIHGRQRF
ncbi:MAG TPA: hypothetical protein VIG39_14205, partial [Rhizomicrobium sp.]